MSPIKPRVMKVLASLGAAVLLGLTSAWGQTYSHARIVRLSFVEGTVTVQRPGVDGWAEAPMNTPIQEGFKLSTEGDSFAAVEFENGSTVRIGQFSLIEFTQLALASDGSKINRLTLDKGYATFRAVPQGQDVYEVLTANGTVSPRGKAMFRVDADSGGERLEVFGGSVDLSSSLGSRTLGKDSVLELKPDADQPEQISEGITKDDWDRWVQEQESRPEITANNPTPGAYTGYDSGGFYGWSDLSYYGSWAYLPGGGYGWSPNVAAGWSPYLIGRWGWYPGFGYTWISGDPWGWLPYHYGMWEFVPGMGWEWIPGGFDDWYPALVTWYIGPGWIGWAPLSGAASGGAPNPCLRNRSCGVAVSLGAFQSGQPVRQGTTLPVSLLSGKATRNLGIAPGQRVMLPGNPVAGPAGFAGKTVASGAATAGFAARRSAPGPKLGMVYNPVEGRYVNGSLPSSLVSGPMALPIAPSSGSNAAIRSTPAPSGAQRNPTPVPTSQGRSGTWGGGAASHSGSGGAAAHMGGMALSGGGMTGGGSHGGGASSGGHR